MNRVSSLNDAGGLEHMNAAERRGLEVARRKLLSGQWTKSQKDFFTLALIHDLLPWRDEEPGMTLKALRQAMAALGCPLTDRQLRYCLNRGADVLLLDVDNCKGKRQYWKRADPASLCAKLWALDHSRAAGRSSGHFKRVKN